MPQYAISQLREALSNPQLSWSYQGRKEEESSFRGDVVKVVASNITIPESEVLGEVSEDQFTSIDGKYMASIDERIGKEKAIAINCIDGVAIIFQNPILFRNGKRIEGYWHSEREPHYPMPIPNELTESDAQKIYELIKIKEAESEGIESRGFSISRIDKTMLDGKEYHHKEWLWPADFAKHYVLKHRVKPSNRFLAFIGYQ